MIAARSGRTDITNILLEAEHIDLDIQENVSVNCVELLHSIPYHLLLEIASMIFTMIVPLPILPG